MISKGIKRIKHTKDINISVPRKNNPTAFTIEKLSDKPSVRSIKEKKKSVIFYFQQTETNAIQKEINRLNNNKLIELSITILLGFKRRSVKYGIMKLLLQDISQTFLNSLM